MIQNVATLDYSSTAAYVCDVLQLKSEFDSRQVYGTRVNKETLVKLTDE